MCAFRACPFPKSPAVEQWPFTSGHSSLLLRWEWKQTSLTPASQIQRPISLPLDRVQDIILKPGTNAGAKQSSEARYAVGVNHRAWQLGKDVIHSFRHLRWSLHAVTMCKWRNCVFNYSEILLGIRTAGLSYRNQIAHSETIEPNKLDVKLGTTIKSHGTQCKQDWDFDYSRVH